MGASIMEKYLLLTLDTMCIVCHSIHHYVVNWMVFTKVSRPFLKVFFPEEL